MAGELGASLGHTTVHAGAGVGAALDSNYEWTVPRVPQFIKSALHLTEGNIFDVCVL